MYSDRLFAQAAHLIFWFSIARYSEVHDRLVGMGWEVNPHPFIWVKPTAGIVPRPGHDLRQAYEAAFICTRGGRMLSTKRNWFEGDPPDDRFHQSQKNESVRNRLDAVPRSDLRLGRGDQDCKETGRALRFGP